MGKNTNIDNGKAIIFQLIMVAVAVYLFFVGVHIVSDNSQQPVASKVNPRDSTVTIIMKRDSAKAISQSSEKTVTKVYNSSGTEADSRKNTNEVLDAAQGYFILSVCVLALGFFLPRIQTLTFKDLSIQVLEAVQQEAEALNKNLKEEMSRTNATLVNVTQESSLGRGGRRREVSEEKSLVGTASIDDLQKGRWGGLSEKNGRRLSARVKEIDGTNLFDVDLMVESTNVSKPLQGKVKFHLHNTFVNPTPEISVIDGKARLRLVAWGAFTVGAQTDDGQTTLELDLASAEVTAPQRFKDI